MLIRYCESIVEAPKHSEVRVYHGVEGGKGRLNRRLHIVYKQSTQLLSPLRTPLLKTPSVGTSFVAQNLIVSRHLILPTFTLSF